jgi:hypothetical protein
LERAAFAAALVAGANLNQPMRPEFDDTAVFPRPMLAALGPAGIVNRECRYSRRRHFLTVGVVAIR